MEKDMTEQEYHNLPIHERANYFADLIKKIKWTENGKSGFGGTFLCAENLEQWVLGEWIQDKGCPTINAFYRIKPEPEYERFTMEDAEMFIGKIVKSIKNGIPRLIVDCDPEIIILGNGDNYDYEYALKGLTFLDGSPFGKKVV